KDLHHARRSLARSQLDGANQEGHATNRCTSLNTFFWIPTRLANRVNRFQTAVSSVTCCGPTPTRTLLAGAKTTAASPLPLVPTSSHASYKSTTWISFAVLTRLLRMDTSSFPNANWLPSFLLPATAASLTMRVP